jgi:bacterioferritin
MKAEPEITQVLNGALKAQLAAINQFFMHARMLKNWGLGGLDRSEYGYSIKAMKQADALIERILFLEALPNLQNLRKLLIGEDVPEILGNDLALQTDIRKGLQSGLAACEAARDYVSRELLEELLEQTEEHIDWIESQVWLIGHTGLENYLQSQMTIGSD